MVVRVVEAVVPPRRPTSPNECILILVLMMLPRDGLKWDYLVRSFRKRSKISNNCVSPTKRGRGIGPPLFIGSFPDLCYKVRVKLIMYAIGVANYYYR